MSKEEIYHENVKTDSYTPKGDRVTFVLRKQSQLFEYYAYHKGWLSYFNGKPNAPETWKDLEVYTKKALERAFITLKTFHSYGVEVQRMSIMGGEIWMHGDDKNKLSTAMSKYLKAMYEQIPDKEPKKEYYMKKWLKVE